MGLFFIGLLGLLINFSVD